MAYFFGILWVLCGRVLPIKAHLMGATKLRKAAWIITFSVSGLMKLAISNPDMTSLLE
jgi:hypothetical protein